MSFTVAIVGGGISGLAAAHRLLQRRPELRVTVYEASARVGGIIRTERVDGYTIEAGPDSFISAKPRGVGLSTELGLDSRFQGTNDENRGSFLLRGGKLHPMPEGLTGLIPTRLGPMVKTGLISPWGKLRMALDFVKPPVPGDEDETLEHFIERRLGGEAYRNLIEPLMAGIYSGNGAELSLAATFPQLRTAERLRGGLIKGVLAARREAQMRPIGQQQRQGFLSFQTGLHELPDALHERIVAMGGEVLLERAVERVERRGDGTYLLTVDGSSERVPADAVILATPATVSAGLLQGIDADAASAMAAIPQVSTALIALGLRVGPDAQPPKGFGYLVPRAERRPVKAMTWLSSKWANRAPAGHLLIRAFVGRSGEQEILQRSDAELVRIVQDELREVVDIIAEPEVSRVYRWPLAMPQYTLGHLDRVERIETAAARIPGLAIAGNMFRGVGIPDCIESGESASGRILEYYSTVRAVDHKASGRAG
ncbi:MAG TPA: protoporphyrinogen oxidase [Thermomicrobiales bacterium]|nr:protoporphyrinogen oxidase [Thermomicrobiales bacterium]